MTDHIRAAIFDLDGTLVDSVPDIAAALNAALAEAGHGAFDEAEVARMVGHGARRLIERALGQGLSARAAREVAAAEIDGVLAAFTRHYGANPYRLTRLYPDTIETLEQLAADGWRLGVCTNKPEGVTGEVLAGMGLARFFPVVVGGSTRLPLKPSPDMLLAAIEGLCARRDRAVMVGDGPADAGAAAAANVPAILLRHGYSTEPLERLPALAVLDGFADLPDALITLKFPV